MKQVVPYSIDVESRKLTRRGAIMPLIIKPPDAITLLCQTCDFIPSIKCCMMCKRFVCLRCSSSSNNSCSECCLDLDLYMIIQATENNKKKYDASWIKDSRNVEYMKEGRRRWFCSW